MTTIQLGGSDRGSASPMAVMMVVGMLVVSASVASAGMMGQVQQKADQSATVEQASVDVTHTDRLEVTPTIGDEISLENTEVRVTFPQSEQEGFVVTDIGRAADASQVTQTTVTQEVEDSEERVPVYRTEERPVYEEQTRRVRDGTQTVTEQEPVYRWSNEIETRVPQYRWERSYTETETQVSQNRPGMNWMRTGLDHTERVKTGTTTERVRVGSTWERTRETTTSYEYVCESTGPFGFGETCSLETTTEVSYSYEIVPNYEWVTRSQYSTERYYEWTNSAVQTETTVSTEDPGSDWTRDSSNPVGYETQTEVEYQESRNAPGDSWERGEQVGTTTVTSQEPAYTTVTEEVQVGTEEVRVLDHYETVTQTQTTERTVYEFNGDAVEETNREGEPFDGDEAENQGLETAMEAIPHVGDDSDDDTPQASEVVSGVGGSATSGQSSMWANGESFVVQLSDDIIEEGDLVHVQVIDTESQSVIIDRTRRASDLETVGFDDMSSSSDGSSPSVPWSDIGTTPSDGSDSTGSWSGGDSGTGSGNGPGDGSGSSPGDGSGSSPGDGSGSSPGDGSGSSPGDGSGSSPGDGSGSSPGDDSSSSPDYGDSPPPEPDNGPSDPDYGGSTGSGPGNDGDGGGYTIPDNLVNDDGVVVDLPDRPDSLETGGTSSSGGNTGDNPDGSSGSASSDDQCIPDGVVGACAQSGDEMQDAQDQMNDRLNNGDGGSSAVRNGVDTVAEGGSEAVDTVADAGGDAVDAGEDIYDDIMG